MKSWPLLLLSQPLPRQVAVSAPCFLSGTVVSGQVQLHSHVQEFCWISGTAEICVPWHGEESRAGGGAGWHRPPASRSAQPRRLLDLSF